MRSVLTPVLLWGVLCATACGELGPRQARFELDPCPGLEADAFDPSALRFDTAPQLGPGGTETFDSVDALNPSVVRFRGRYLNLYSGFDGATWRTGVAESADGVRWSKRPEPILQPELRWEGDYIAANGAAVVADDRVFYWYQAGPRNRTSIGAAASSDGERWDRVAAGPVLEPGARGSWDESAVGDPYAVRCGETFYLYYLGQNGFGVQRLGLARSDDGLRWVKSHLNPVLEPGGLGSFDERGLGEPAVFRSSGRWRMVYTGRDVRETRRLGWAESDDGLRWRKTGPVQAGEAEWNAQVVCDPTAVVEDGRVRLWYGGGDVASPDENLDGAITEATVRE